MASVVFDQLWDDAFQREGELVTDAAKLASIYRIASAVEAIRLAQALQESGRPFFECCDAVYKTERDRALHRLQRRRRLSDHDIRFIKKLLDQAMKGW